jgi:hypothetical protein
VNLIKTIGSWFLSLISRAPALGAAPVEETPMPSVAGPGWEQARAEAEAEIARRKAEIEAEQRGR